MKRTFLIEDRPPLHNVFSPWIFLPFTVALVSSALLAWFLWL